MDELDRRDKRLFRECGKCKLRNIPRVEWPWWKDGRPVHLRCLESIEE